MRLFSGPQCLLLLLLLQAELIFEVLFHPEELLVLSQRGLSVVTCQLRLHFRLDAG